MVIPGLFIDPDTELEAMTNPNDKLGVPIFSGYQALRHADAFLGRNRLFDEIVGKLLGLNLPYEDQCSVKYYFDLVAALRNASGEFERVVEVGCYMGGSASIIAGIIDRFDCDFDIVDISEKALLFTFERIRRAFPEAAKRIRLFHGTLPQYVAQSLEAVEKARIIVHHDGAHDFVQVTKDLASLSFLRDRLHSLIIQDTHLRGTIESCNFVDMAIYAVFGTEVAYQSIGSAYSSAQADLMNPNRYQGNYFMPDVPEGIIIPMNDNSFKYPHPMLPLESFL